MTSDQMLKIYYLIEKTIKRQYKLTRNILDISNLELEDIHHELYCQFLEKNKDKEIEHLPTYIDKFCSGAMKDLLDFYTAQKRAEINFSQYDEECSYGGCDQESIIIEIIDKKYR
jgi:oligoribonuclease NrnB/cAMP/cGMP phosphodiesterase (DHH superfamily)